MIERRSMAAEAGGLRVFSGSWIREGLLPLFRGDEHGVLSGREIEGPQFVPRVLPGSGVGDIAQALAVGSPGEAGIQVSGERRCREDALNGEFAGARGVGGILRKRKRNKN